MGRQLNRTVEGYNRAVGSLERRLMPFSRRFQEIRDDETEMAAPEPIEVSARTPAPSNNDPETG
jgi:DNA recombination protein RmuC